MAAPTKVNTDPALKDMEELGYYEAKAKAESAYAGKAVTEMYYPKGLDPEDTFYDWGVIRKTVTSISDEGVPCALCGAVLAPFPRHFTGESLYCTECLKQRWFYSGPRPDGHPYTADIAWSECPVEVLSRIVIFLTEYRDLAAFSRVSRKCFEACNGDSWYESEMTKIKRFTISKEITIQRNLAKDRAEAAHKPAGTGAHSAVPFWDTAAGEFCQRLEVGNYMGEFMEPTTTPERKRRLVGLMAGSQYVARQLGPQVSVGVPRSGLLPPRYAMKYAEDAAKGTLQISSTATDDTSTVTISLSAKNDRYVAEFEGGDVFKGRLFFDVETALFLASETNDARAPHPKCTERKCVIA